MTLAGAQVILRAPMRRSLVVAALAAVLALPACSGPCEDLGSRLCRCAGAGTTREACERAVKNQLDRANAGSDVDTICEQKLDTCDQPSGADFCEWTETACGKASCGLSAERTEDACTPP